MGTGISHPSDKWFDSFEAGLSTFYYTTGEVQRIPAYDSFLNDLLAETEETHPDYEDLNKAAKKVQAMVKERREEMNVVENEHKVENVQDRFPHDDLQLHDKKMKALQTRRRSAPGAVIFRTLSKKNPAGSGLGHSSSFIPDTANANKLGCCANANRLYVLEGSVQLTAGLQTQDRYLFLFNDLLLIAKQKSSTTFKLKHRIRVGELWTATCLDEVSESTRTQDKSFVMGWPTTNVVATFTTPEMKDLWITKLQEHINAEKQKEQPKTMMLKVLNKDMDAYPTSKTLPVTNDEEAQEVVRRCMEEFQILEGASKDYQLWVVSGKEDSPYPLIGHEHPYSIKMSHLRDMQGTQADENVPMDVDANDNTVPCQFILRQTKKVPSKHSLEETSSKRAKKSKKSPLMNFFKKSQKQSKTSCQVLGKLFCRPLPDISDGENIPQPVMDMLHLLFLHGPFTTGIFRKSANHRVSKELREKLDQGEEVPLDDIPVVVIAATFKDFLRSLPESLFLCELYDDWTEMVDMTEDHERIQKIQDTLQKLPECHVYLIRHLMCVLYHIDKLSTENNMPAYNLAICIGQSLLWPPLSQGPGAQANATRLVPTLIQFLIEHCQEILGENCVSLFGELPMEKPRQDSSTDSDSMHSLLSIPDNTGLGHRDNSSIDSLEREFYNSEMESSPQLMKSQMSSNTNLSRDSGLTLSDTQLYEDGSEMDLLRGAVQRKQSLTRSVSQMDDPIPKVDTGPLSSSYEGSLHVEHPPPVPPPRKPKRRVSEPPMTHEATIQALYGRYGQSETDGLPGKRAPLLRHTHYSSSEIRRQMRHVPSSKRVSNESLGSLEEDAEQCETPAQDDFSDARQRHRDMGVLRKSDSGAQLYMDDVLVHDNLHAPAVSEDQCDGRTPVPSHDNIKRPRDCSVPKNANRDSGRSSCSSRSLWADAGSMESFSGSFADDVNAVGSVDLDPLSASYVSPTTYPRPGFCLSPPQSPRVEQTVTHYPAPTTSAHEAALSGCGSLKRLEYLHPQTSKDSGVVDVDVPPPRPPKLGSLATSHSLDDGYYDKHYLEKCAKQQEAEYEKDYVESSPPKGLMRSSPSQDHGALRRVRVGMTPTGADIFPKHMRNVLRHSLHEDDFRQMMKQQQAERKVSPSQIDYQRSKSQDSYGEGKRLQRQMAIEKSPSDTLVSEQLHQQQKSQQAVVQSTTLERRRPDKPPSYQEAIQRKSLLKSGKPVVGITQQDIIQQKMNESRARQLYEDSRKKYEQEHVVEENTGYTHGGSCDDLKDQYTKLGSRSPPPYPRSQETKCEQSRRVSTPPSSRQSPENTAVVCGQQQRTSSKESTPRQSRERTPPSGQLERSIERSSAYETDRQKTPPRETRRSNGHSNMRDAPRSKSESRPERTSNSREKSSSRSRDRSRMQRLSDTRLENARNKEKQARASHLCRSKSDSSEHLNRIGKFKELKALDNNILEKYKKELANNDKKSGESRIRRRSVNSVKNKDWHKELAEQYNEERVFFQPEHARQTQTQYAYVRTMRQDSKDGGKTKRRWTPPIHPTKDLVIINQPSGPSKEHRTKRTSLVRNLSKPELLVQAEVQSDSQRSDTSDKENRPSHEPKSVESTINTNDSPMPVDGGEQASLTWSVKQLCNLYDTSKTQTDEGSNPHFYNPSSQPHSGARGSKETERRASQEGPRGGPPPYRNPPPIGHQAEKMGSAGSRVSGVRKGQPAGDEESYV